jgi:hypothetical protein
MCGSVVLVPRALGEGRGDVCILTCVARRNIVELTLVSHVVQESLLLEHRNSHQLFH